MLLVVVSHRGLTKLFYLLLSLYHDTCLLLFLFFEKQSSTVRGLLKSLKSMLLASFLWVLSSRLKPQRQGHNLVGAILSVFT